MARVIHFEIHADNPERAIAFYTKTFGWEFKKWDGPTDYWMIATGPAEEPGINGGLIQRQCPVDGQAVIAYVCTIGVTSVDESVTASLANGGTVAMPKFPIPTMGWLAYCKDPEGNIFGMMEKDPNAA